MVGATRILVKPSVHVPVSQAISIYEISVTTRPVRRYSTDTFVNCTSLCNFRLRPYARRIHIQDSRAIAVKRPEIAVDRHGDGLTEGRFAADE